MAKKRSGFGWPKKSTDNAHARRELELFVDNDSSFYRQRQQAEAQLARVICRKKAFSVDLAARVFEPILAAGAKKYSREFSSGTDGLTMFSAATRRALAKEYATDFKSRVNGYLRHGQQDLEKSTMDTLNKCSAKPLAGRKRRR